MGKMMSFLEKYKFVEKDIPEADTDQAVPVQEATLEIESATEDLSALTTTSNDKGEDTMPTDYNKNDSCLAQEKTPVHTQPTIDIYHSKQQIDAIYQYVGLDGKGVTDTAFFLENLINALPNELPEYVKKTTVNNIISASNIDINKLITDGKDRFRQLENFQESFSNTNYAEIAALKQEIDRLTTAITNYHQEIKQKELLIQEETELIEAEKNRLNHILTFFEGE